MATDDINRRAAAQIGTLYGNCLRNPYNCLRAKKILIVALWSLSVSKIEML